MKNQCQNDFKIGPHLNSGKKLEKAPNIGPTWGPKTIPRGSKKTFEIALKNNFKSLTKLKQKKSSWVEKMRLDAGVQKGSAAGAAPAELKLVRVLVL